MMMCDSHVDGLTGRQATQSLSWVSWHLSDTLIITDKPTNSTVGLLVSFLLARRHRECFCESCFWRQLHRCYLCRAVQDCLSVCRTCLAWPVRRSALLCIAQNIPTITTGSFCLDIPQCFFDLGICSRKPRETEVESTRQLIWRDIPNTFFLAFFSCLKKKKFNLLFPRLGRLQVFHLQVPLDVPAGGKVEGSIAVKRQKENVRLVSLCHNAANFFLIYSCVVSEDGPCVPNTVRVAGSFNLSLYHPIEGKEADGIMGSLRLLTPAFARWVSP